MARIAEDMSAPDDLDTQAICAAPARASWPAGAATQRLRRWRARPSRCERK